MSTIPKTLIIGVFLHGELHLNENGELNNDIVPDGISIHVINSVAPGVPNISTLENYEHMATQISKIIDLNNFVINKLPIGYDTIIGERGARLSGGQIQRIGIARALYLEPEILIFDESTSALDYHSEDLIMNNIVMLMNKTIITITHRLPTLMNADIIFLMDEGEIVFEGKYNELLKNNKSFQKITSFK